MKLFKYTICLALLSCCFVGSPIFGQLKKTGTKTIAWDHGSLKKVSSSSAGYRYCGYGRIIQLHDLSLLAIYEADGSIVAAKSKDLGLNWSESVLISSGKVISMANPDVLELQDHSLLVCYNQRPAKVAADERFAIRTKKSADGGLTWKDERLLYEAGNKFEDGCWEPSALQLPGGELQLYFANEGVYANSSEQNISMLRSADKGLTWTKTPEVVSFRPGKRDGMPVPLLLNNKKDVVFAIEDNGIGAFKPGIIRNSIQENWAKTVGATSANRAYALTDKIGNEIYAGAPYLRQLKTGETILSYQGTEGRINKMENANMKVVIGDEQARNFSKKSIPFDVPANKSCLWNSLTVLKDNTVIAVTSTNAYSANTEVWMIKGRVVAEADPL